MQHVNLYVAELRPPQQWLSAKSLSVCVVGMLLIFGLAAFVQSRNLQDYQQQVELLENQLIEATGRLDKYKDGAGNASADRLKNRVAVIKNEINQRNVVKTFFQSQKLGNDSGYAGRMMVLANETPRSIALQRIRFSEGASRVELQGLTQDPAEVARMLADIQNQDEFEDSKFGVLTMSGTGKSNHHFALGFESLFDRYLGASSR
jgi:Tfp pilus assembly protein PilN